MCSGTGEPIGQACADNWDDASGQLFREAVARQITERFASGCIPISVIPVYNCELDWGGTFDVCLTDTGPCCRYQFSFLSLQELAGERADPEDGENDIFTNSSPWTTSNWIPYAPVLNCRREFAGGNDWLVSQSYKPGYGSTTSPFQIWMLSGGSWTLSQSTTQACVVYGPNTSFRIRGSNQVGFGNYCYTTTGSGGGGAWKIDPNDPLGELLLPDVTAPEPGIVLPEHSSIE